MDMNIHMYISIMSLQIRNTWLMIQESLVFRAESRPLEIGSDKV